MRPTATLPISAADGKPLPPPSPTSTPSPTTKSFAANPPHLFKKHKLLPHPKKDASSYKGGLRGPRPLAPHKGQDLTLASLTAAHPTNGSVSDHGSTVNSQPPSPRALKHYPPKRESGGPDLPPTPPAHSRNSSSTYSVLPSSATYVQSPERSTEDVQIKPALPTTPTKQMSPPTPDVTPPHILQQEDRRMKAPSLRPPLRDRNLSKGTTDSRTESFRTARENPSSSSSDNEDGSSALRPDFASTKASESAAPRVVNGGDEGSRRKRQPKAVGLGLGLESSPEGSSTPRSRREFVNFDGDWGFNAAEEATQRNGNSHRNAVAEGHRSHWNAVAPPLQRDEVVEDSTVTPTNATKALRSMSLPQRILTFPSPDASHTQFKNQKQEQQQQQQQQMLQKQHPSPPQRRKSKQRQQRQPLASAAPIAAEMASLPRVPSDGEKDRRISTMSSKSTVSTVVEALLVGTPPQRQRTLRHVKKQVGLRDSGLDLSPTSSVPTSLLYDEGSRQRRANGSRFSNSGHDSMVSTTTINSISSRSARREIWKAGGIPVVVVPGRMSSAKSSSREPSLRSTSSRRSRRSQSLHSVPLSHPPKSRDYSPYVEQRKGRSRTYSESDGSAPGDQRTIDFPPVVPRRTSSLSAPTSRNASRSGSLTAESVHVHTALLASHLKKHEQSQGRDQKHVRVQPQGQNEVQKPETAQEKPLVDSEHGYRPPSDTLFPEVRVQNASFEEETLLPRPREDEYDDYTYGRGEESNHDRNHDSHGHFDPRTSVDRHVDQYSARHLSPHNTPFSLASIETTTTHHSQAEVSEALAVNIYPHQNTSVLVVDHSTRPSDCSDDSQRDQLTDVTERSGSKDDSSPASEFASARTPSSFPTTPLKPEITASNYDAVADVPATPSQQLASGDDVDSPLRNPRIPPEPPAINFIPATPSGLTPTAEEQRHRGNYFEEVDDSRTRRRSVSLVLRRALSRGRTTEYGPSASRTKGLLIRTLSLTRGVQKRAMSPQRFNSADGERDLSFDVEPAEEDKLHPFWRPASSHYPGYTNPFLRGMDDIDNDHDNDDNNNNEETYRYPPIDNRPRGPQRSLSSRLKKTFAILPVNDPEDYYPATSNEGPDRRTVRRTPSGNLRVVKYRGSVESLSQMAVQPDHRPYTAPERQSRWLFFWRPPSLQKERGNGQSYGGLADTRDKKIVNILPNLGDKLGEYGPHTIPRRFSERRREKRSNELRQMISAPQEVRDGVGEVIRRTNYRDAFTQAQVG
ncbi:hypothetical protein SPI_00859 [Niveomyces insectorum RCEF 264]|uniref:Uncharacterized protein n=1 Tax=Niveomyces insectorum RCEF 264 TaxID=1081102 RepID=A0A162LCJ6_9HYPO|nr:hypothetical protein SPI_00859 [Niveomyces insectorum RCEF 264]